MKKIAVLSNININPITKMLNKHFTVYEAEGYGNELELLINRKSSLHLFQPETIFLIEDLMEVIHHEMTEMAARAHIKEWFEIFTMNLEPHCCYYVSDAYLYGEETVLSGIQETTYCIESIWNTNLHNVMEKNTNVFLFPYRHIIDIIGEEKSFSRKMWYMGKIPHTMDAHKRIVDEIKRLMRVRSYNPKKVLVLDLDNTLWGGLAGEDDIIPIVLSDDHVGLVYKNTQRIIKLIKSTGVVLCIVSKNNPGDANSIIANHPHMVLRSEDFVIKKINWNDKVSNIKEIAKELNVGLDSIVFIDDSDYERQFVKEMLPEVEIPKFPKNIEELPGFMADIYETYFAKAKLTDEDKGKTEAYLSNVRREELKSEITSFEDYLRKLDIKVERVDAENNIERILQLVNKTNQFNLTTKRYTMQEMQEAISGAGIVYAFRVTDKFGDSGIVAVVIVNVSSEIPSVEEFAMSCRVMGRNIEYGLIDYIEDDLLKLGYKFLRGIYIPTNKNYPVFKLYNTLGYKLTMESTERKEYEVELNNKDKRNYVLTFSEMEV